MERDLVTQNLADNIKRLMEERGIKAPEVAEKAKLNRTIIYDIMKQRSMSPKVHTVAKIAKVLKVPISDMFLTPAQLKSRQRILDIYNRLPPERRDRLESVGDAWLLLHEEEQ